MKECVQISTTVDTRENAEKIARTLVQNGLAACAQVFGPIASVYWWRGKVEEATEWLCVAKTRRSLFKEVESSIQNGHPYQIPEILAVPIVESSENYRGWMLEATRKRSER